MVELGPLTPDLADSTSARLAATIRQLIGLANSGRFSDEGARSALTQLEQTIADLAGSAESERVAMSPLRYFASNPVSGAFNPLAPPVLMEVVDGPEGGPREIRGTVNFAQEYEGPPRLVHGGYVAAALDDSLGMANFVADMGALTGTLTIRYRKPTPLRTNLRIEARCLGRDGRKISAWAGLYLDDLLLAEADGLFIEVGQAQMDAMSTPAS
ncbi:PaaI family thioesterase [Subtercola endophyticus]|uniref:PaaI family thioesterase n=1 Tax=Subtercola endophyticus TaxID=2895559 RepID=UPI001E5E1621|nr:PaaI family thioesterase [Subtercola endophyticus]UFS58744.1 hypothetical protein LQ955_17380 [Subtercola endophyticus]